MARFDVCLLLALSPHFLIATIINCMVAVAAFFMLKLDINMMTQVHFFLLY